MAPSKSSGNDCYWHHPNVLVLTFLRQKKSVAIYHAQGEEVEEGCGKEGFFLASRKKIHFRIEFKTKFGDKCSLALPVVVAQMVL